MSFCAFASKAQLANCGHTVLKHDGNLGCLVEGKVSTVLVVQVQFMG